MPADDKTDDNAARKARADAIRRARDRRNEHLDAPVVPPTSGTPPADEHSAEPPSSNGSPNYVEFIDRKMREKNKPGR